MPREITEEFVWQSLPQRPENAHKGSQGRLTLVAGSRRYRGAAALCAEGALRCGAGLVTLAAPEAVIPGILARLPEIIFLSCGPDQVTDPQPIREIPADTLCIGPGLGNTSATRELTLALTRDFAGSVLLDADGLNALAGTPLPRPGKGLVITPHPGEMARLADISIPEVEENRAGVASGFARASDCVVVLKGHRTIVAGPGGEVFVNPTGGPGLSRGGSGDILAGMIAGLAAQGLSPLDAAVCGVWLHGAAAAECAKRLGQYGMLPHDIFRDLGALFAAAGR